MKVEIRRVNKALLVLACLVGICACSTKIEKSNLTGRYQAQHGNGVETINLDSNGSYTHSFTATDGTKSTSSNRWTFEPYEAEPHIALQGFVAYFPGAPKADIVLLGVERKWGRLRLYLSYDRDVYYEKVSDK